MNKKNDFSVIITAASRRVALIKNFKKVLENTDGKVIAVDYDPYSSGLYFADKHYEVPLVNDREYLNVILKIAKKRKCQTDNSYNRPGIIIMVGSKRKI